MNQARSGRYYAAEEFEEERRIPWMALLGSIVLAAIFCAGSFIYGHREGYGKGYAAGKDTPRPTIPAPASALTQWQCTPAERKEYVNTCSNRLLQELRK